MDRALRLVLTLAGTAAVATWLLPAPETTGYLVLFGALDRIHGPFGLPFTWIDHLDLVAGVLGVAAMLAGGAFLVRGRTDRRLAGVAALVLGAGAVYLVAWLVDPPDAAGTVSYGWGMYAETAAIAAAALAAAELAISRAR